MKRTILAFAAFMLASPAALADSVGIPACDEFLTKYEACVGDKVPEAQRATFKMQIQQLRKGWSDAAKNAGAKPGVEASCKQTSEQMKVGMQGYGCSF